MAVVSDARRRAVAVMVVIDRAVRNSSTASAAALRRFVGNRIDVLTVDESSSSSSR